MHYQDDGKHFGNRLREARLGAGLSQSELEELSGIPKARLSRYENGHVEPSIQTLARLARALNVSEASLLGDQRAIMEDFFNVLHERGVQISSKEQGIAWRWPSPTWCRPWAASSRSRARRRRAKPTLLRRCLVGSFDARTQPQLSSGPA